MSNSEYVSVKQHIKSKVILSLAGMLAQSPLNMVRSPAMHECSRRKPLSQLTDKIGLLSWKAQGVSLWPWDYDAMGKD